MDNPRPEKVAVVDEVRGRLEASQAALLTEYRGLNVADISALRRSLRQAGGDYKIYKNTLVRFAARDLGLEIEDLLTGPTAIAFVPIPTAPDARSRWPRPCGTLPGPTRTWSSRAESSARSCSRPTRPGPWPTWRPAKSSWLAWPVRWPRRWCSSPGCSRRCPAVDFALRPQGPHRPEGRGARNPSRRHPCEAAEAAAVEPAPRREGRGGPRPLRASDETTSPEPESGIRDHRHGRDRYPTSPPTRRRPPSPTPKPAAPAARRPDEPRPMLQTPATEDN